MCLQSRDNGSMSDTHAFDAKDFLKTLTSRPGVYRMLNADGKVLYVGKAKNLSNRVSTYFTGSHNRRIASMVSQIADIQITVTHTEAEALILENNLIKEYRPRYNVLLRDDKSYPYIYLSSDAYPRLSFYRGSRDMKGRFFGPYPSSTAVKQTLKLLQKLFPVRQCEDSYYNNRSRPCLQYQIGRCTAPCVGFVSEERYAEDVRESELFLEGKASQIVDQWIAKMENASENLEFEEAAKIRDQISALRTVQERQYVSGERGDLDIVAIAEKAGVTCVQIFFIRQGHNLGNKTLYPSNGDGQSLEELMSAFIARYYLNRTAPSELLLSCMPDDSDVLIDALSTQAGRKVSFTTTPRGARSRWLDMAKTNARMAVDARLATSASSQKRVEALQQALALDDAPVRMECFDISHTSGQQTVASCVVFENGEPYKRDYRRFNIKGIQPGDDYAAMKQALTRRYQRLVNGEGQMPDILLIDGGKGQLSSASEVMQELGVTNVLLLGVAKGVDRKPGLETLFLLGDDLPLILPSHSPALHLVQHIRDEAHRFAITGHRARRAAAKKASPLEEIAGVGPKRRQRILKHFGGLQGLSKAGIEDIAKVEGISTTLAKEIYEAFHGEA